MKTTPARRKNARKAMAEAESYTRELLFWLREEGVLEHHPELAAMADSTKTSIEQLRQARLSL